MTNAAHSRISMHMFHIETDFFLGFQYSDHRTRSNRKDTNKELA
jgi:hypothetical protein